MISRAIGDKKDLALLIIRLVLGVVFFAHGIQKFQTGIAGVSGFFGMVGIPAPMLFAWLVTLLETFGGLALLVGVFSRLSAFLLAIVMVVATIMVKYKIGLIGSAGPGAELELALLAGLLAVVLQGPGRWSVEHKFFLKELS